MRSHVLVERAFSTETFIAQLALKLPSLCMCDHVRVQLHLGVETHLAQGTLVRSEHQMVTLLVLVERPGDGVRPIASIALEHLLLGSVGFDHMILDLLGGHELLFAEMTSPRLPAVTVDKPNVSTSTRPRVKYFRAIWTLEFADVFLVPI